MIVVESKRKKPETILKQYPDAILADVCLLKEIIEYRIVVVYTQIAIRTSKD